jgi:hypothetical protein
MNSLRNLLVGLTLVSLASLSAGMAQERFCAPLRVTCRPDSIVLYFSVLPNAHFCIDESDTVGGHGEFFLPPIPPGGIFDARLVWPRTGSNLTCFDQGSPSDFRPFIASEQSDTFKVRWQFGSGNTLVMKWPSGLSSHFSQLWLGAPLLPHSINMLVDTTADLTGLGDLGTASIYSVVLVSSLGPPGSEVSREFALLQNYPNPFNPSTTIRYRLAHSSFVTLTVYNTLGQQAAQPVNERRQAGNHEVVFRGDGLVSGVYIYRLTTPEGTIARKMLLLR